jgi:hypothetical protein
MEPSDFKDSPTGREVASAAQIAVAERRVRWLSYWHMTWHEWSKEWLDASAETDVLLRLTSDELAQMSAELHAVINRWYRLSEEMRESKTDASGPSRQRCLAFINAFPLPDEEKQ